MDSIHVTNPYLRSGSPCRRFKSAVQLSLNRSPFKLPALALILAEVLVLQAYSPSRSHDYVINLPSSEIRRGRVNRRKFAISNCGRTFNVFCATTEDADAWAAIILHASSRRFDEHYHLGRKIADGRHSQIFMAYANHGSPTEFVVKVNNRTAECNSFTNRSQFERDAHLKLVHSFDVTHSQGTRERKIDLDEREHREHTLKLFLEKIVPIRDSFGTTTEDFLVFEYQDGELLSTALATHGRFSEREARIVMWDVLTGLHYMHEQGVVHRDIRASNVFCWRGGDEPHAKLFDLSEARQIPDGISAEEPFSDSPGESRYKAVEILSGRYHGKSADVWACGVLLYHMLSGAFPFEGEDEQALGGNIFKQLQEQSLFRALIWDSVSQSAISLIRQMLHLDPFKRPSALGARSHQWLSNGLAFRRGGSNWEKVSPIVAAAASPRVHKLSPLDASMLPAPLEICGELGPRMTLSQSAHGIAPADIASMRNDTTQKSTPLTVYSTVSVGKKSDIGCTSSRSFNCNSFARSENPVPLDSCNSPLYGERYDKVAISNVTRPTSASSLVRQGPLTIPSTPTNSPIISPRPSSRFSGPAQVSGPSFLRGNDGNVRSAQTHEAYMPSKKTTRSLLGLVPLTKRYPDRQISDGGQRIATHLRIDGKPKSSSNRNGQHSQDDPLFHFKVNPKTAIQLASRLVPPIKEIGSSSTTPVIPALSTRQSHRNIPLQDEMCKKTFVMHSVRAAAKVGLSEFSKRHPVATKLLLRSPSAQLQLAMVLPYRRKFRTAGIALTAMFRIISLKKGTCLTRRVVRGQTLPTELWTLLTDIRRKCHMRPLRARMPKLFPPDKFGRTMCKTRFEPPPRIETTPIRFWARQRDVRLGIISRAWEVAKEKIAQLSTVVGVGRRNDLEEVDEEETERNIASPGLVSYFGRIIYDFFRRDIEEEEKEEKYHHTQEMV